MTIDELIRNSNPFAGHTVVRPAQIWGKSFPDVPSINAHASDAVFQAVEQIRRGQRETVGITITAEKGLGKSQIISRIRHRLQTDDDTLFVYMSKYDNLNQIKYQFLQNLASSLRTFGKVPGVTHWQELACCLINELKKWNYTPNQYISWFSKYSKNLIDDLTKEVLKTKPELNNPYLARAILWTLSSHHATYANYWLSGWELTQAQSEALGLPYFRKEDRETEALSMVRQILHLICDYKIPVICFDEIDIADLADNGYTAAQVIANLTKDLYNNLKRGVLLLAMYPDTWNEQIRALPQAEAVMDRLVSEQPNRQPIDLKYLHADDVVAVVSQWLKEFYEENKQTPPHPIYPFDEYKLRELGKGRPTIRAVLKWCAENFVVPDVKPDPIIKIIHPVEPFFQNELANLQDTMDSWLEDKIAISDALELGLYTLMGETVEGVKIDEVTKFTGRQCYLDFKIIGQENEKPVKIGLAVLQQSGGRIIQATLRQLIDYQKYDLTRGCLVRSKKISPSAAQARNFVRILLNEKGGEWVKLQAEDIKPLLAIRFVYDNHDTYDLKKEQIVDFIKQKELAVKNPLIREILSAPSGQEPDNLIDEDMPISIPQTVPESNNELVLPII